MNATVELGTELTLLNCQPVVLEYLCHCHHTGDGCSHKQHLVLVMSAVFLDPVQHLVPTLKAALRHALEEISTRQASKVNVC